MALKSCIVLMPFKPTLQERFAFFQRCGKALDLDVQRIDTYSFSGNIPTAIARALVSSDLVLADLSDTNANVVYEVAIAQCMGQRMVLVTNDRNSVPFDLQGYRTELVPELTNDAAASLTHAMQQALSATYVSGPLGGQPVFGQRIFARRTGALALDLGGVLLISLVLSSLFEKVPGLKGILGLSTSTETSGLLLTGTFLWFMYYAFSAWGLGATLGQRALDRKIVDYDGRRLSFKHSVARATVSFASVLTYGVGYLWGSPPWAGPVG